MVGDAVYLAEEMVASAVRTTGISDPTVKAGTHQPVAAYCPAGGPPPDIGIEVWDADRYPAEPSVPTTCRIAAARSLKATAMHWGVIPS